MFGEFSLQCFPPVSVQEVIENSMFLNFCSNLMIMFPKERTPSYFHN